MGNRWLSDERGRREVDTKKTVGDQDWVLALGTTVGATDLMGDMTAKKRSIRGRWMQNGGKRGGKKSQQRRRVSIEGMKKLEGHCRGLPGLESGIC